MGGLEEGHEDFDVLHALDLLASLTGLSWDDSIPPPIWRGRSSRSSVDEIVESPIEQYQVTLNVLFPLGREIGVIGGENTNQGSDAIYIIKMRGLLLLFHLYSADDTDFDSSLDQLN